MKFHFKEAWVLTGEQSIRTMLRCTGRGPKKFKQRKVNLDDQVVKSSSMFEDDRIVEAGDSLEHVRIGSKIRRMLVRTIRMNASRSNMVFPTRQKTARDLLEEHGIPFRRPRRKHA